MVKKEEDNSGIGYKNGQYLSVLYNPAVLRHKIKDKTTHFHLLVQLQQLDKRFDNQESRYKRVACFE